MFQGGVSLEYIKWMPFDGIGRKTRVGLNFTERGFGLRGAVGCSDRANSAASQLKKGDIDWDRIFGQDGIRWFHTGGIFAALSTTTPDVITEAVTAAKRHGTIVSYDLNYRNSLWRDVGGQEKAREVNRALAPYIDVMLGNEEDFTAALGFEVAGLDKGFSKLDPTNFRKMIEMAVKEFPNFKVVATTLRHAKTATKNDWGAVMYANGQFYDATLRPDLEIYDRVGGGDSFASGLIYGLMEGKSPEQAVNYGAAHGALAMTTPGDTTMATLSEVEKVMKGAGARVDR
jgi:2-dehydro-3-deoxygluconokinase